MKEKLLISACLLGVGCRYDGGRVKKVDVAPLAERFELIPVCPEIMGGLPTPRVPSERIGDRVLMKDGSDVTENFLRGAEDAYLIAQSLDAKIALLKERSPSCGSGMIYDGSFSGNLTYGDGVAAEYLKAHGIDVYGESEIDELLKR